MSNTKHSDAPLAGLERHYVGRFPATLLKRRETVEHTLSLFEPDEALVPNRNILSRTTHLYRATSDTFEPLRQALIRNQKFVHVEVLHEASDLGIPYKILARDRDGREICYDGVLYRVTESVHKGDFGLDQIDELAGCPGRGPSIIDWFGESLREIIPEIETPGYSVTSFYTVKHTDWDTLGLRNEGDANLRLICKDMNVFTVTALIFTEIGRDYAVYLGDWDVVLQMIGHDLCAAMELKHFLDYFGQQRTNVEKVKEATITEISGMLAPVHRLFRKHQQWNSVKNSLRSLISIQSMLIKGDLLIQALSEIVEGRFAYFNGPRQIWLAGEEHDDQEKIQHLRPGFFEARLEEEKITNLSDKPSEPMYTYLVDELRDKMKVLHEETGAALGNEKDLLTAFQTEFSLYAVWLAVIALVISLVVSIVIVVLEKCL